MMILQRISLIIICVTLNACAFGQKINYTGVSEFLVPGEMPKHVALAVSDRRPYIVSGDHSLQWVGYSRPPLGIPYGVHTKSGRPLSDDFADLLKATLATRGITAEVVSTLPFDSRDTVLAHLFNAGVPANFLVTLNEWKTDSYVGLSVSLDFSVTLEVLSPQGKALALSTQAGSRSLSDSQSLAAAVTEIYTQLFTDPAVRAALRSARPR
jgi:hypothetical protein